jgi:hypothetical protein
VSTSSLSLFSSYIFLSFAIIRLVYLTPSFIPGFRSFSFYLCLSAVRIPFPFSSCLLSP